MNTDTRILIVDDEAVARDNIRSIVSGYCEGFSICGEAENAIQGLKQIKLLKPEIVLLDIEMPGGTGFEMLDSTDHIDFEVVFITAYERHAIKAFKYRALDYVLKPIDIDDIKKALERTKERIVKSETNAGNIRSLAVDMKKEGSYKLAVKSESHTDLIDIKSIIRMEASGSYTSIFLKDKVEIVASRSIKHYELLLAEESFIRIHNSHIINLDYLKRYSKKEGYIAELTDGTRIPVAVRRKDNLERFIKTFAG